MKSIRSLAIALGACFFAAIAFTSESRAQAKEGPKAAADFDAGIAAYQAKDLPAAFKDFLKAATAGHADSQFNVALMYEQGIGVGKDEKEAVDWYSKAAEQGNAAAQFNLAVLYEHGRGTEVEFTKANEWYRKAAIQGDALAIGNLGMLYLRGDGVKENRIAGLALLLLSASRDQSPENHAKQNLAAARGLTADIATKAQILSTKLGSTQNMLLPLDQYLQKP